MKAWTTIDKQKEYPHRGPWDSEPDKIHWVHAGLDCLIVRGPMGALCGYVGVPESHPYFGDGYDNHYELEAHGGLTFAARCQPSEDEAHGICHPKQGAANETVWWFGFDCAHCNDVTPKFLFPSSSPAYRDVAYVTAEVERLAEQLAEEQGNG